MQIRIYVSTMSNETMGSRIIQARKRAGLTSAKLADAVGCRSVTVWRWESGNCTPNMKSAQNIARVCGVSLSWLVDGSGRMSMTPPPSAA